MSKINFTVTTNIKVAVVAFDLEGNLTPKDLNTFTPPDIPGDRLVILSGRGPIWLFGVMIHHYHYCQAVATHDPRLGGAVVVESHSADAKVGDVVPLPE